MKHGPHFRILVHRKGHQQPMNGMGRGGDTLQVGDGGGRRLTKDGGYRTRFVVVPVIRRHPLETMLNIGFTRQQQSNPGRVRGLHELGPQIVTNIFHHPVPTVHHFRIRKFIPRLEWVQDTEYGENVPSYGGGHAVLHFH